MPRPSWARYKRTPCGACPIRFIAASSCWPQSHRSEPKTSPVTHSEWRRTRTSGFPRDVPLHERHMLFARERADEGVDPEVPVARRKPSLATEENVVAEFGFETRHGPPFRRFRRI